MTEKHNGEPRAAALLTYGAAERRLTENGHRAVSALAPEGRLVLWPVPQYVPHDEALISEHPVAVCVGALILEPIEDQELDKRRRAELAKHGLLEGPVRIGSDGAEVRPVHAGGPVRLAALEVGVLLLGRAVVPLDGKWSKSLLEVTSASLPTIAASAAEALTQELRFLVSRLASDRRPKPQPSRMGWL